MDVDTINRIRDCKPQAEMSIGPSSTFYHPKRRLQWHRGESFTLTRIFKHMVWNIAGLVYVIFSSFETIP